MHQRCRHSVLIFIATLVLLNSLWSPSARAAAVAGSSSATEDDRDGFVAVLDERMPDLLVKYGVPGSIIAGIEDGRVAWTRAYGVANRATGEPMQADMLVEHGSNGKAVTAWAVAKLVEAGKVDLDAPANMYLKRWQLTSTAYDANAVTVRRLLNHTSGLNIYGYLDYSPRRAVTPSPMQVLDGVHLQEGVNESLMSGRLSSGRAGIAQQPGSGFRYSGAAYTVLQVLIEDVADESFDVFVQREITDPLGATSMRWEWSPELRAAAARPHGNEGQVLEYRQLASHAIGSEIATVADFARFVAAAVPGPNGEPAGRGVLKPETVQVLTTTAPGTPGGGGLGYNIAANYGEPAISHSGANSGWVAYYFLDTTRRIGFVVASNSSRASPLHQSILNLWSTAWFGQEVRDFPPAPRWDFIAVATFALAGVLGSVLLLSVGVFIRHVQRGRRKHAGRPSSRGLLGAAPWLLWLLFIWYTLYAPLPLYLPHGFPDLWPSPAVTVLTGVLLGWLVFRVTAAFFPRALDQGVADSPAVEAAVT